MADNPNRVKGGKLRFRAPGPRAHRDFLVALGVTLNGSARPYQLVDRDARRILRKIRGIKRGRGRPPKKLSPFIASQDALRLLKQCQQTGFPPPESLVDLITVCLDVSEPADETKPNLTDNQWIALEVEARYPCDREPPKWPSTARATIVAGKAGVTSQAVHGWRKDPEYRKGLFFLLVEQVAEAVSAKRDEVDQRDAPDSHAPAMSDSNRLKHLDVYIKMRWKGPVPSMLDGEIYNTAADYTQHLFDHGIGLVDGELSIVKQK